MYVLRQYWHTRYKADFIIVIDVHVPKSQQVVRGCWGSPRVMMWRLLAAVMNKFWDLGSKWVARMGPVMVGWSMKRLMFRVVGAVSQQMQREELEISHRRVLLRPRSVMIPTSVMTVAQGKPWTGVSAGVLSGVNRQTILFVNTNSLSPIYRISTTSLPSSSPFTSVLALNSTPVPLTPNSDTAPSSPYTHSLPLPTPQLSTSTPSPSPSTPNLLVLMVVPNKQQNLSPSSLSLYALLLNIFQSVMAALGAEYQCDEIQQLMEGKSREMSLWGCGYQVVSGRGLKLMRGAAGVGAKARLLVPAVRRRRSRRGSACGIGFGFEFGIYNGL